MSSTNLTVIGMFLTVIISLSSAWVTNLVMVGKQEEKLTNLSSSVKVNTADIKSGNKRMSSLESASAVNDKVITRLIPTLDKLDETMNTILIQDAVQDEKINANASKIERLQVNNQKGG